MDQALDQGAQEQREQQQPAAPVKMQLKVVYAGGASVSVLVTSQTPLKKLFNKVAAMWGKDPATLRFHYDGVRLRPQQTPGDHDMEDEDQIEAELEQLGG